MAHILRGCIYYLDAHLLDFLELISIQRIMMIDSDSRRALRSQSPITVSIRYICFINLKLR